MDIFSNAGRLGAVPLAGLSLMQLRLMAEILATGTLGLAADRLNLAQPAASRLLAQIEGVIGHPVHRRDGRGLRLTEAGAALARRAARVVQELAEAGREVAGAISGTSGTVRIGAVTGPALKYVMPVLARMRADAPDLSFEITVATSDTLCDLLLGGRIDFFIGRLPRPDLSESLSLQVMGDEPLSLVVRRGHPLLLQPQVTLNDALRYDWAMPENETLLTRTVLSRLAELGAPLPKRQVSTASFLFTLALVNDTDAIAPLSQPVAEAFASGPVMPFVQLPLNLGLRVEDFGLVRRKHEPAPPAVDRVVAAILAQVGRCGAENGGS